MTIHWIRHVWWWQKRMAPAWYKGIWKVEQPARKPGPPQGHSDAVPNIHQLLKPFTVCSWGWLTSTLLSPIAATLARLMLAGLHCTIVAICRVSQGMATPRFFYEVYEEQGRRARYWQSEDRHQHHTIMQMIWWKMWFCRTSEILQDWVTESMVFVTANPLLLHQTMSIHTSMKRFSSILLDILSNLLTNILLCENVCATLMWPVEVI